MSHPLESSVSTLSTRHSVWRLGIPLHTSLPGVFPPPTTVDIGSGSCVTHIKDRDEVGVEQSEDVRRDSSSHEKKRGPSPSG